MSSALNILGGGPAGSAAAIAARREGSEVCVIEKSRFPRHKVCGEFFSPEIVPELEKLGVWDAFQTAAPARVERMKLHFGSRVKTSRLPDAAWGLSRYAFDALMLDQAQSLGAKVVREGGEPRIVAVGRKSTGARDRVFGFKAHFEGPVDDAIELFFFDGCYVGINSVENGRTNVCGLGPEDVLHRDRFNYDELIQRCPALAERLRPLKRSVQWLSTGPLRYCQTFDVTGTQYRAGDALSFVDPFTGSGLLAAIKTGALAGTAAAHGEPVAAYLERCRKSLRKPFQVASLLRTAVASGWADRLAGAIPGRLLFALTRPHK